MLCSYFFHLKFFQKYFLPSKIFIQKNRLRVKTSNLIIAKIGEEKSYKFE
jgi:hypothetical protein